MLVEDSQLLCCPTSRQLLSPYLILDGDVELVAAVDAGKAAVGAGEDCEWCESV